MIKTYATLTTIKVLTFLLIVAMVGVAVGGSSHVAAQSAAGGKGYSYNNSKQDETPPINIALLDKIESETKSSIDTLDPILTPDMEKLIKSTSDDQQEEEVKEDTEGFVYCPEISLTKELQEFTYKRSNEVGVEYSIVLALMWRESEFNQHAVGYNSNGTRDSGIMQINDVNAGWLGRELNLYNLMDPKESITAGTEMLGRFVSKHGLHNGLMAYQHGEQGMLNKLSRGITKDSQIDIVYTKSQEFQRLIDGAESTQKI